jgi:hypothetical protein
VNGGGRAEMGEKGNLIDVSEGVFANLAEQGPQFWLAYEQYKESRSPVTPAQAALGHGESALEPATHRIRPPAAG